MPCAAYTSDLTSGQTFSASGQSSGYEPSKAFDDNTGTYWYYVGTSVWIQVQFSEAKAIARATVRNVSGGSTSPSAITIKGSNTGSFSGEETELYSTSGLSWTNGETKTFDFDNEDTYTYCRLYMTVGFGPQISEIELMECAGTTYQVAGSDGGKFGDSAEADFKNRGEIADTAATDDSTDAFSLTDGISDSAGAGDSASALVEINRSASDTAAAGDTVDAFSLTDGIADSAGIEDDVDAGFERVGELADSAEIGDITDGFNWSAWLRENADIAVIRYFCTLTGAADGLADVVLPISSWQARKRAEERNYLSVVIPGLAYADQIADRSNGEIVIEMAYLVAGVEAIREEIIRVDFERSDIYQGPISRSISISGYGDYYQPGRSAVLTKPTYKNVTDGSLGFRFAVPDPYLNPGDGLIVPDTGDELTVGSITYAVAARGLRLMEVRE